MSERLIAEISTINCGDVYCEECEWGHAYTNTNGKVYNSCSQPLWDFMITLKCDKTGVLRREICLRYEESANRLMHIMGSEKLKKATEEMK